jgi:predicted transcriptional regulator
MEETLSRIERILAMILVHDMQDASQADKALALSRATFSNKEFADLLGTSQGVVNQQLYTLRRGSKSKKASSPK